MINEKEEVSKSKLLKQKIVQIVNGCFPKAWTKKKGHLWNHEDLPVTEKDIYFCA